MKHGHHGHHGLAVELKKWIFFDRTEIPCPPCLSRQPTKLRSERFAYCLRKMQKTYKNAENDMHGVTTFAFFVSVIQCNT